MKNGKKPKRLKLACADFTFPLLPHKKVLDLIAMLDFDGVDIGLFEERSHLWPSKELKSPAKSGKKLGRKAKDRGLKIADVFLQLANDFESFAINQPDVAKRKKARDTFTRLLDYADASGSHHVTCLPGVTFASDADGESWKRACDELAWRVAQAKDAKLIFSVEAHVGSIAPDPTLAQKLVNDVPGLTLTLDYTHFIRIGMNDDACEPLVKHASHFHARGARKDRLQAPAKENIVDYPRVLKAMRASGYNGYVGVEYVWIDWEHCNECDNLSETILLRDQILKAMANSN